MCFYILLCLGSFGGVKRNEPAFKFGKLLFKFYDFVFSATDCFVPYLFLFWYPEITILCKDLCKDLCVKIINVAPHCKIKLIPVVPRWTRIVVYPYNTKGIIRILNKKRGRNLYTLLLKQADKCLENTHTVNRWSVSYHKWKQQHQLNKDPSWIPLPVSYHIRC